MKKLLLVWFALWGWIPWDMVPHGQPFPGPIYIDMAEPPPVDDDAPHNEQGMDATNAGLVELE